jgi:hypothetical protein
LIAVVFVVLATLRVSESRVVLPAAAAASSSNKVAETREQLQQHVAVNQPFGVSSVRKREFSAAASSNNNEQMLARQAVEPSLLKKLEEAKKSVISKKRELGLDMNNGDL